MRTIIDSHTHLWDTASIEVHMQRASSCNHSRIGIACTVDPAQINANPPAFACKALYPQSVYIFAGLDHTKAGDTPSLADQVRTLDAIGVDGIKIIESKPTSRHHIPIPLDAEYYQEFFGTVDALGLPVIWHVADPEEFWNPSKLPTWAQEQGWGYGDDDVQKEALYAEVENVLHEHPTLKATFAHFYFLSGDLERAGDFLDRHPLVNIDLAPGVEMLYNISTDPEQGCAFFSKYADRIVYGTDMFSSLTEIEADARAGMVRRWLETDDVFTVAPGADFLLGRPDDGTIRGMRLSESVLNSIYVDNFTRLCGANPREISVGSAIEECSRIAGSAQDNTEAEAAAKVLRALS